MAKKECFTAEIRNNLLAIAFLPATLTVAWAPIAQGAATDGSQSNGSPNAGQQKNSQADLKLAARIRRAVYSDKSLSTRAHNVTIIVRNGTVTLRGIVETAGEKDAVHRKATALAGSATINDMLTVKER